VLIYKKKLKETSVKKIKDQKFTEKFKKA